MRVKVLFFARAREVVGETYVPPYARGEIRWRPLRSLHTRQTC
jgi:hypothetical protein